MNGRSRRYLELGGRADDFSAVHLDTDAGYNIAAGRLTHLVEQGRGLAAMQREGQIDVHAASKRKRELRREILLPIAHCNGLSTLKTDPIPDAGIEEQQLHALVNSWGGRWFIPAWDGARLAAGRARPQQLRTATATATAHHGDTEDTETARNARAVPLLLC